MRSLAVLFALAGIAHASPNVALEDPRYDELARRAALGELDPYQGGFAPLSEARVRRLLGQPALPRGGWLRVDRAMLRASFDRDRLRRYSTPVRERRIAGGVAITCEHAQGRPCIGSGVTGEVDGSAGWGDVVSGTLRLRTQAGSQGYDAGVAIDRLYVLAELGLIAVEVGRDVLAVGPRSRTQVGWGDHAPPLDHVRLSTARPWQLTDGLAGNAQYIVGRLRDPQTFTGNLVTIGRGQLDIGGRVEVGIMQLLMLGGDGAPAIGGPIDFVLEHVRRRDITAGLTDSSNRRFGGDVAVHVPEAEGLRLYYQLVFEDIRARYWYDAVRYDADHVIGAELAALGPHAVTFEYTQTGVRSHEHSQRITGLTNAGRIAGAPLGQDARSFYLGARVAHPRGTLYPWVEAATATSDMFGFMVYGPIFPTERGVTETRLRAGSRLRVPLAHGVTAEAEALVEHVERVGFEVGRSRVNGRLAVGVVWQPR